MIRVNLRERGANGGLYGTVIATDERGRRYKVVPLAEMAGDTGHEDEYERAATSAPPARLRPRVVEHVELAIEEADKDGHPIASDLRDVLDRHRDEDGDEQRESYESRETRKLRAWCRELTEGSESSRRRAREVARALVGR